MTSEESAPNQVLGERELRRPSIALFPCNRGSSSILAVALMSVLGLGSLTWYYANTMTRQSRARQSAQSASANRAQGETALPSLGRIDPPPPLALAWQCIAAARFTARSRSVDRKHAAGDSRGRRPQCVWRAPAQDAGADCAGAAAIGRGVFESKRSRTCSRYRTCKRWPGAAALDAVRSRAGRRRPRNLASFRHCCDRASQRRCVRRYCRRNACCCRRAPSSTARWKRQLIRPYRV